MRIRQISYAVTCLILLSSVKAAGQTCKIDLQTLVNEAIQQESVTRFPEDYRLYMVSSRDRRSVTPSQEGWFANDDFSGYEYIDSTAGRAEKVLFDEIGPGVLTRGWITALNKEGKLRFYFDGESSPRVEINAYDFVRSGFNVGEELLFPHTSYNEPLGMAGGSSIYIPIPFSKRLKITLEEKVADNKQYYQFEYRRYSDDVQIQSLNFPIEGEDRIALQKMEESLSVGFNPHSSQILKKEGKVACQDCMTIELPSGKNVIEVLNISALNTAAAEFENIVITISFDDKTTVNCRLSDFVGAGMGAYKSSCRYFNYDGQGNIESFWPMPYKRNARLLLKNLNDNPVNLSVTLGVSPYKWTKSSLYFHAATLSKSAVSICGNAIDPTNDECHEERLFAAKGRGVMVGTAFSLFNHCKSWYGEGDEKIWVDDDTFPSLFGTGLEDYYNTSWAPVVPFLTPYGGAIRADLPNSRGYNSWLRARVLDLIPFRSNIAFDLEMLGWYNGTIDYDATTFWYGDKACELLIDPTVPEHRILPPSPPAPQDFRVEGAVEFESLDYSTKSRGMQHSNQDMTVFSGGDWSGGKQVTCFGGKNGDYIEYCFSGYDDNRKYNLELYACMAADYGMIQVDVNDQKARVLDMYDTMVTSSGPISLGTYSPCESSFRIRVTLVGANPKAVGQKNIIGLDCMTVSPATYERDDIILEDFETAPYDFWTFEGNAFFNERHTDDQVRMWGDFGYLGDRYLSSFTLADQGVGRIISKEFTIERDYINFLIGGGNYYKTTYVALLIDGKEVCRSTALNSRELFWSTWDVREYEGKKAQIEVVDNYTSYYGFIAVDHFFQSDRVRKNNAAQKSFKHGGKYLHLPIKTGAKKEKVEIISNDKVIYEFYVELEGNNPDFFSSFTLHEIEDDLVVVTSETAACLTGLAASYVSDNVWLPSENSRPAYHFTAPVGWLNDPNGLYWGNGKWNMFYQHNPFGCSWGNISWGHATSDDLVNWEYHDDVILPDERGLIFSGGAYIDRENKSGLQNGNDCPILLFYTCAGNYTLMSQGNSHSQCMAVSLDGGKTFNKSYLNPVLAENYTQDNRDPDVFWDDEHQQWVMALFLFNQEFCILTSPDLVSWKLSDRFIIENCEECPDMFRLPVENSENEYKWVIMGANSVYIIGDWDGEKFIRCGSPTRLDHGNTFYAGQTFADAPENRRVLIGWHRGSEFPGHAFNQQMSIPREIKLYALADGTYRLKSCPVQEVKSLWGLQESFTGENIPHNYSSNTCSLLIQMSINSGFEKGLGISINGYYLALDFCKELKEAVIDDLLELEIYVDKASIEVFSSDGSFSFSDYYYFGDNGLKVNLVGNYLSCITNITMTELNK